MVSPSDRTAHAEDRLSPDMEQERGSGKPGNTGEASHGGSELQAEVSSSSSPCLRACDWLFPAGGRVGRCEAKCSLSGVSQSPLSLELGETPGPE